MKKSYVKHLEMIESIIVRLAGNSFKYKGWCITGVSAFLALAAKESCFGYALIGLVPTLCFWGLDAYYLSLERAFRELYKSVAAAGAVAGAPGATFSMDLSPHNPTFTSWCRVVKSWSILPLYIPLVASLLLEAVVIYKMTDPTSEPVTVSRTLDADVDANSP